MKIALIGQGAIAQYVIEQAERCGFDVAAIMVRAGSVLKLKGPQAVSQVSDLTTDIGLVVDCAGHQALGVLGPQVLSAGFDMLTLSIGALADETVATALQKARAYGQSKLHLASGAIGALDCLAAAKIGKLQNVTYVGRKPPKGWMGSPAEDKVDLAGLTFGQIVHFEGTARTAALSYPKNANVAAAVALAGVGFDQTQVQLIADADVDTNIHEIRATGEFGTFHFKIEGNALPDNPRTSALAAMSVVSKIVALMEY